MGDQKKKKARSEPRIVDEVLRDIVKVRTKIDPPRRSVSFGEVDIHEFEPTIGDSPSVSSGAPITLSKPSKRYTLDLEEYEFNRRPRRTTRQLLLSKGKRERLLLEQGFKRTDIAAATRQSRKARHDREHSYYNKSMDGLHESFEETRRKIGSLMLRGVLGSSPSSAIDEWKTQTTTRLKNVAHTCSDSVSLAGDLEYAATLYPPVPPMRSSNNGLGSASRRNSNDAKPVMPRRNSLDAKPVMPRRNSNDAEPVMPRRQTSFVIRDKKDASNSPTGPRRRESQVRVD